MTATAQRGEAAWGSSLPPDLALESARTWDAAAPDAGIPAELRAPVGVSRRERLAALTRRHALREQRARTYVAASMNPDRGLPIAPAREVLGFIGSLLLRRRAVVAFVVVGNAAAAVCGLLVPRLLGDLVDSTVAGIDGGSADAALTAATSSALVLLGLVVAQSLLTFVATAYAGVLGQGMLASAREHVVRAILRLPLSRVESASSGDLVTRVTRDVGTMSESVRWALPQTIVGGTTVILTLVAMIANSVLLAAPSLLLIGLASIQIRRYLARAPRGYLTEGGTYSRINTTLTETVEGARTVEALGLSARRLRRGEADIEQSGQAERYTMTLRNMLFIVMDFAFSLPRVLVLSLGAVGIARGWVTLGQVTTAVLYVEAVWGPFDLLVHTVDRVQVGIASTTRLLGISVVPPDREAGDAAPDGSHLAGRDLRYAYRPGHDVLHGIDLTLRPGERLAIVGPSGSGKSTLGRLLAGIHGPRTGAVTVGGVNLVELPLEVLRREVALVTQEHHVFIGTLRDNVALAGGGAGVAVHDSSVVEALRAVGAWSWVDALPDGLDTRVGSGGFELTPGRAQQVALARLVLADPHTIVLDEATSLIDPRTARHLEGSLGALLEGRTVVAIAHRLHTAHDADRIAVVIEGTVAELGSHDELVAQDGEYAALWRAWTS